MRDQDARHRTIKGAAFTAAVACVLATGVQITPSLARPHPADLRNEFRAFARATKANPGSTVSGIASVYHDRITANGEHMNPAAMTAAHRTLPFGSRVTVVNRRNGRSATVRINDRGPYVR